MSTCVVFQCSRCLCTEIVYRYNSLNSGIHIWLDWKSLLLPEINVSFFSRLSHCQSYLVGIVVPDPEVFVDWAKEQGFEGSYEELCQNPVCCIPPLNFIYCTFLHANQKQRLSLWSSTGCNAGSIRGHESFGEGSRSEVFWTSKEAFLTLVVVNISGL